MCSLVRASTFLVRFDWLNDNKLDSRKIAIRETAGVDYVGKKVRDMRSKYKKLYTAKRVFYDSHSKPQEHTFH